MTFLEQVHAKRQKLADVLEEYSGIRRVVEELYPDRAHFIYELLQNAEDVGATEATFELTETYVAFEHNGRTFHQDDIEGITNIGEGTKQDQEDKIGRFGVGFKAVFAYSETPHIWSQTYSFKITKLVLPIAIPHKPELGQKTRFEFPFNNPKKLAPVAYAEVKAGLDELAETTLLFLSNLKSINWRIAPGLSGKIQRIQHSEYHIEGLKTIGQKTSNSSHFLRFSMPVKKLATQSTSIAYALDFLPNVTTFDVMIPLSQQFKIIPSTGRVSVYFPAEKETSSLRFHLHAPFVPELSRASVKDTPVNEPLFRQLAELTVSSLYPIRDLNLLTGEFLAVLPNKQDSIPLRYQPIRTAIIEVMNNKPLTPTQSKSHAPAKQLLQAKASLKELLSKEDLKFLVPSKEMAQWAIAASQRNTNQDRFLNSLDITEWDIKQFVDLLVEQCTEVTHHISYSPWLASGPNPNFMKWLTAKPLEWHQQLYATLYRELVQGHNLSQLKPLQIVRLSNNTYTTGVKSYFPSNGIENDAALPRVHRGLYSSGKNTGQQTDARKLLEAMGVREAGEVEQVESILKKRYTSDPFQPDLKDLERFINLVEKEPAKAPIFQDFYIFKLSSGKQWGTPSQVFLDSPYLETGLTEYFTALGANANKWALSYQYKQSSISVTRLRKFAEAVGVQTTLEAQHTSVHDHPDSDILMEDRMKSRVRLTDSAIDDDWMIPNLQQLLAKPSHALSRLIWKTLCNSSSNILKARYRPNQQYNLRERPSSLVLLLRKAAWVPQKNDNFVRPSDASRALLPEGFPFDEGYEWLKELRFGENELQRSEEHKKKQATARELGFVDADALRDAQWFASLDPQARQRFKSEIEQMRQFEFPEQDSKHPERRSQNVTQLARNAPERLTEQRQRSVSVGRDDIKQQAEQYLRQQYTNSDGKMGCQVCKRALPFKLDDGNYYFEKVEFLPELQKRHYQNYLALCPNHSAMFQYANGSSKRLKELFTAMTGKELNIILAQKDVIIHFTKLHIKDLHAVIKADKLTNGSN